MPAFTLAEVVKITGAAILKQDKENFTDLVSDTRKISEGVLFIAFKGERFNGEDFVGEALAKGAAGVMVSTDFKGDIENLAGTVLAVPDTLTSYQQLGKAHREKFNIPVVAITGSNGKTTTKDLTAAVLSARGSVAKTQANFNNEIGIPLTLLSIEKEHMAAVVEIGMRGLHQIEKLAPLVEPTIGIVTNVGETHIELLGSVENIAKAKGELVEAIPAGGTVILNNDNEYVAKMRAKVKEGVRVNTFGIDNAADVRGGNIRTAENRTTFTVAYAGKQIDYTIAMVGRHNVYNALAAISVGLVLGFSADEIQQGLDNLEATKMRFELKKVKGYNVINDAYNASPMSMSAAINTVAELTSGRKIAVVGDMLELGDFAVSAHKKVGQELAAKKFTAVITRGKMGEYIAKGAREGGIAMVYACDSHEQAADRLKEILLPNDTILFKGSRGMQMDKIIDLL